MAYSISEIKQLRKKLGLNQTELAQKAGVSQSLIAKIESGNLDPTYTKAQRIFEALNSASKKTEQKVEKIMQKKIISVNPDETVLKAVELMKKHAISQVPVISKGRAVGLVSEATIIKNIGRDLSKTKISEIMEDAPALVSKNTSVRAASNLLAHFPVILIADHGEIIGIITKADLLKNIA